MTDQQAPPAPGPQAPSDSSERTMFRQEALEQLGAPGRLDALMRVTSARVWISLAVVVLAIAAAVVWSILGAAKVTVSLNGVLNNPTGLAALNAPATGTLTVLNNVPNLELQPGQQFATILTQSGTSVPVRALVGGVIADWLVSPGAFISAGTPMAKLYPGGANLLALMYTSSATARTVFPGMQVDVTPDQNSTAAFGSIVGQVVSVGSSNLSTGRLTVLVGGNEQEAASLQSQGPYTEIDVALQTNPLTASGYQWTSGNGPPFSLDAGTTLNGTVIIGRESPSQVLFGG